MVQKEHLKDISMNDEQNGDLDTLNQEEAVEDLDTSNGEDEETLRQELEEARKQLEKANTLAENYKIRAEKAERKQKEPRDANQQAENKSVINNALSRDEAILIAKGYDDEALEQLGKVAKATSVSLTEALKDPLFIAWQDKREAEKKAEQARLGASKGSAVSSGKPSFVTPGLSADEHKRLWKETMAK